MKILGKSSIKKIALTAALISTVTLIAGCNDDEYACTVSYGVGQACTDSTGGQCSYLNGTFHPGVTCSDLGYTSG